MDVAIAILPLPRGAAPQRLRLDPSTNGSTRQRRSRIGRSASFHAAFTRQEFLWPAQIRWALCCVYIVLARGLLSSLKHHSEQKTHNPPTAMPRICYESSSIQGEIMKSKIAVLLLTVVALTATSALAGDKNPVVGGQADVRDERHHRQRSELGRPHDAGSRSEGGRPGRHAERSRTVYGFRAHERSLRQAARGHSRKPAEAGE